MIDPIQAAVVIGAGLAALLTGLGIGVKRGRRKAIAEGEPAEFSQAWMERAERHFSKMHADAGTLTEHSLRIDALEASYKQFEGEMVARALALESQIRALTEVVSGLRADIAALRGEMGFERRQGTR